MPNGDADLDIGGNHSNSDDDLGDDFDCNDKRDDEELCKFCYQNPKRVKIYGFCSMQCRKAKKEATTYIKKKKKKKQPASSSSTTSSSTSTGSASTLSSLTTRSSEPPPKKAKHSLWEIGMTRTISVAATWDAARSKWVAGWRVQAVQQEEE